MAYLTKSRFKLGLECPTKLYYDSLPRVFKNMKSEDPFMMALAKGGFQVGELAKIYYPEGTDITAIEKEEAIRLTEEELQKEEVTVFEAAIKVGHKFIRVDILNITDEEIQLIEVKSKSCEGDKDDQFYNKSGGIDSKWRPYLEDLAFQYIVVSQYFEARGITTPVVPYLCCPDKKISASVSGIHEQFVLKENERGRSFCEPVEGLRAEHLGDNILSIVNASVAVDHLIYDSHYTNNPGWEAQGFLNIMDWFEALLSGYENGDGVFRAPPSKNCKDCQFRTEDHKPDGQLISGVKECFSAELQWTDAELKKPKVWDVWDYRRVPKAIGDGKWFMDQMDSSDVVKKGADYHEPEQGAGLERVQRQWVQIEQTCSGSPEMYVDRTGLKQALEACQPPYHFIDFETQAPAIPFYKDYTPYQGLCFQYSHHTIDADGSVKHRGEYLGMGQGTNPSFEFIDRLYNELKDDEGSVFMYSHHENTYLNYMMRLLQSSNHFPAEHTSNLISFIRSITKPTDGSVVKWSPGPRLMVDMAVMVRKYFWHPSMGGSNSIKQVLPAVMNASESIKSKYSHPIYGAEGGIASCNFSNHKWVTFDETGLVVDPYKLLPTMEELLPVGLDEMDVLFADEKVGNGGAAMTAWAYMQFKSMPDNEREALASALKHYCELDTMAMVLIWEYFKELVN